MAQLAVNHRNPAERIFFLETQPRITFHRVVKGFLSKPKRSLFLSSQLLRLLFFSPLVDSAVLSGGSRRLFLFLCLPLHLSLSLFPHLDSPRETRDKNRHIETGISLSGASSPVRLLIARKNSTLFCPASWQSPLGPRLPCPAVFSFFQYLHWITLFNSDGLFSSHFPDSFPLPSHRHVVGRSTVVTLRRSHIERLIHLPTTLLILNGASLCLQPLRRPSASPFAQCGNCLISSTRNENLWTRRNPPASLYHH